MNNKKDIFDKIMSLPVFCRFYSPYKKYKSILLYIFFGGCTTIVSIGTFVLFDPMLGELLANVLSWIFAVAFAYVTNRIWVFSSNVKGQAVLREMLSFYSGRLITLGIEEVLLLVCVTLLQFNGIAIKTVAQFIVLISNYLISKLIIFKKKDENEK